LWQTAQPSNPARRNLKNPLEFVRPTPTFSPSNFQRAARTTKLIDLQFAAALLSPRFRQQQHQEVQKLTTHTSWTKVSTKASN